MKDPEQLQFISVIVPCHPRCDHVRRCLRSLAEVDYPRDRFEVLVVNDGPSDGIEELMNNMVREVPALNIRFFSQSSGRGTVAALNTGIVNADHEILAFVDETLAPDRMWLRRGAAYFSRADVGGVEGAVVDAQSKDTTQFSARSDASGGGRYSLANMFLRRELFDTLGVFDVRYSAPGLGIHGSAGIEFAYRVCSAGWEIPYAPEAVCINHHTMPSWKRQVLMARRRCYDPLLKKQHPELFRRRFVRQGTVQLMARAAGLVNLISLPGLACSLVVGWTAAAVVFAAMLLGAVAMARWPQIRDAGVSLRRAMPLLALSPAIPWLSAYHFIRGVLRFHSEPAPFSHHADAHVYRVEELAVTCETFSPNTQACTTESTTDALHNRADAVPATEDTVTAAS